MPPACFPTVQSKSDMNRKEIFSVIYNRRLTARTMLLKAAGATGAISAPGQFVNIAVDGKYLRRPISLFDYDDDSITLLYDVVGDGTEWLATRRAGDPLDILTGLGNGFQPAPESRRPLLLGGGVGIAPMFALARRLRAEGKEVSVVMGYNTAADVAAEKLFADEGFSTYVATVNGSRGTKGFVTDAIDANGLDGDYFYACGPLPMMRALCSTLDLPGQLSLDQRMACGFGACMCCSLQTRSGDKRICKDGPIFFKEDLIWK